MLFLNNRTLALNFYKDTQEIILNLVEVEILSHCQGYSFRELKRLFWLMDGETCCIPYELQLLLLWHLLYRR